MDGGVIQEQHVLFFVADGTGGAVLKINGAAEELEGRFLQHTGGIDAAGGLLPPVDGVVVHIQLAAGFQKIADVGLQCAVVAGQVDLAALVGGVAAQDQVRDLDLGPAFAPAAHVVEAGHALGQALDLHQADQSALFGVDLGLDRGQALAFALAGVVHEDRDLTLGLGVDGEDVDFFVLRTVGQLDPDGLAGSGPGGNVQVMHRHAGGLDQGVHVGPHAAADGGQVVLGGLGDAVGRLYGQGALSLGQDLLQGSLVHPQVVPGEGGQPIDG